MNSKIKKGVYYLKSMGFFNLISFFFSSKNKKIVYYKNSFRDIDEKSEFYIGNNLSFNAKWGLNDPKKSYLLMREGAKLIVDDFKIFSGANINVNRNATLKLGTGYINHNVNIACFTSIEIGNDVAISENVTIRDSDNHQILLSNHVKSAPIKIGDHVWIGMNVTILKGVTIGAGSIIAAGSVVNKDVPENSLAAGVPAKVIKSQVEWK